MVRKEYTFLSNDGVSQIHGVSHAPDGECKAILQITHGMVEFIERYDHFASYLAEHGFLVVGYDHIGHGQSVSRPEDWGYFPPNKPADILTEDMQKQRLMVQEKYPDVPYFILGHSMGSYLLRKYLADYGEGLAGAIIMGTGYVKPGTTRGGIALVKTIAKFKGWHHRSPMIQNMMFGSDYESDQETEGNWLSRDLTLIKPFEGNPAFTFQFTLGGYLGLLQAVLFDCQQKNVDAVTPELPLLIVSGEEDPVGDCGKGVRKVYEMFQRTKREDVTLKLYPEDRHEILNEKDRDVVFEDLRKWMEERIVSR